MPCAPHLLVSSPAGWGRPRRRRSVSQIATVQARWKVRWSRNFQGLCTPSEEAGSAFQCSSPWCRRSVSCSSCGGRLLNEVNLLKSLLLALILATKLDKALWQVYYSWVHEEFMRRRCAAVGRRREVREVRCGAGLV